jgi:hypothetical protein
MILYNERLGTNGNEVLDTIDLGTIYLTPNR